MIQYIIVPVFDCLSSTTDCNKHAVKAIDFCNSYFVYFGNYYDCADFVKRKQDEQLSQNIFPSILPESMYLNG
jgi:hypothetical protein